jgi:TPR repeat protein
MHILVGTKSRILCLLLGAALVAGCTDSKQTAANAPGKAVEAPAVDLAAIKASLANATSADIQAKAEELWTAGSYAPAVELSQMAFDKDGLSGAAYRLGTAYFGGTGVARDLSKALDFFKKPGLENDRYSIYYRGMIVSDPAFMEKNLGEARMLLDKAKTLGVKEAEEALAKLPAG